MATVNIPPTLRKYTHGEEEVSVLGTNVREILGQLESTYPGIAERIVDEQGAVRRFINVFVADEDIRYLEDLETPVGERDEISIVPAIAGGC